jgi:transposase-like protein
VTEAETRLDTELIKVHQNPNMNLKKLANDMGIDYKLVLARWTYLRKTFQLDGLKKGRSSRENLYNSFDEQQVDEWIIEYAEDPQKTLRQLSKEKGIAEGALYRRWNVLRETNGLKGLRGPPINNEIKVLDDKELASLSELDRDIIRYGTSEDLSLNLLCKELGNQTSIFFRWKILKERYQLESPQKKRWRGNKVN